VGANSLYTKYRPQYFRDLVGQRLIVETISREIAKDKISHAYLFSGPKGSGKTTMARLLAKAANCEKREAGEFEPCNECTSCREITDGRSLDVLELDAASHTGVADVAEIREAVRFAPHGSRKRVFIIDEVHMLSKGAFNALLKTLEEPPVSTIFVLATTEIPKVPDTIRSRCQEFHFKRAQGAELAAYLSKIAKHEGIAISKDAITTISELADGSFRDAVSILEQVSGASGEISAGSVRGLLGLADEEAVFAFLRALSLKKSQDALEIISEQSSQGVDSGDFLRGTTLTLRHFLLFLSGAKDSGTGEERDFFEALSKVWGLPLALNLLEKLLSAKELLRLTPVPTLPIEMVTVSWCSDEKRSNRSTDRKNGLVENVENADGDSNKRSDRTSLSVEQAQRSNVSIPVAKVFEKLDPKDWEVILRTVKEENHSLYAILREAIVLGETVDGIALAVRFRFHAELLGASRHQQLLAACVTKVLGRPVGVVVEVKPEAFTAQEKELLKFAQELL
jgi:DNA polymerase-3 subunit gamma/tau